MSVMAALSVSAVPALHRRSLHIEQPERHFDVRMEDVGQLVGIPLLKAGPAAWIDLGPVNVP